MASASAASRVELGLRGGRLLAQFAAFVLAGFALGGVLGLADRLADFVRLAIQLVDFGLLGLALVFQRDEPRDVGLRAAALAVLLTRSAFSTTNLTIEHERSSPAGCQLRRDTPVAFRDRELPSRHAPD